MLIEISKVFTPCLAICEKGGMASWYGYENSSHQKSVHAGCGVGAAGSRRASRPAEPNRHDQPHRRADQRRCRSHSGNLHAAAVRAHRRDPFPDTDSRSLPSAIGRLVGLGASGRNALPRTGGRNDELAATRWRQHEQCVRHRRHLSRSSAGRFVFWECAWRPEWQQWAWRNSEY
jgi:hypothetical protein